jgi:hypothetical protein
MQGVAKALGPQYLVLIACVVLGAMIIFGCGLLGVVGGASEMSSPQGIVAIAQTIERGLPIASAHWPGGIVPYSWGGGHSPSGPGPSLGICAGYTGPSPCRANQTKGVDCSGFVRWVYSIAFGKDVFGSGDTNAQIANSAMQKIPASAAVPGDLVYFGVPGNVHHVGIYIGNNKMINALRTNTNVETDTLLPDLYGFYHYEGFSTLGGSFSVVGPPTVSAALIDQVLAANHSPAQGNGKAFFAYGVQYGIDPVFALAFFQHESTFGTAGVATHTLGIGNVECTASTPANLRYENGHACFQMYASWTDSIQAWYKLIRTGYVDKGNTTIEQIIPIYAPPSDGNNDAQYISAIEKNVTTWRSGKVA